MIALSSRRILQGTLGSVCVCSGPSPLLVIFVPLGQNQDLKSVRKTFFY